MVLMRPFTSEERLAFTCWEGVGVSTAEVTSSLIHQGAPCREASPRPVCRSFPMGFVSSLACMVHGRVCKDDAGKRRLDAGPSGADNPARDAPFLGSPESPRRTRPPLLSRALCRDLA